MIARQLKERKCSWRPCSSAFRPRTSFQRFCKPACYFAHAEVKRERLRLREKAADRRQTRAALEQLKTVPKLTQEAQQAFNAYIRERDRDEPCISCGEMNPPIYRGGQWDAGHYLTVGAHPELRFNEQNAHKQCKKCNGGAGYRFGRTQKTVSEEYRMRLVFRIGPEAVEWLEGPHPPRKYARDELREIRDTKRLQLRQLKKEHESVA